MSLATRRTSWILAISLGLNLFIVAFIVMRWVDHRQWRSSRHERRAQAETVLGAPTEAMQAQREKLAERRAKVVEQLSAPQFDREAASAALRDLRSDVTTAQELMHEQILQRFPTLDQATRKAFAERQFTRPHRQR